MFLCILSQDTTSCQAIAFYNMFNCLPFSATAVGVIWILPVPLLKSIMSRIVHPNKHGMF
jgi:hypothetical protein